MLVPFGSFFAAEIRNTFYIVVDNVVIIGFDFINVLIFALKLLVKLFDPLRVCYQSIATELFLLVLRKFLFAHWL